MNFNKEGAKLELALNLSPPQAATSPQSPLRSSPLSMKLSSPSSCVSWDPSPAGDDDGSSAAAVEGGSMKLVGCPRCLMYVMLAPEHPKCPKCKSSVLLDFFHDQRVNGSKK
ncbi:unnamed protein product [Cuscuta epithymum]|uniref:GIR1-like zinc ribbon domain-containing protein n=1 Tax=Cuscuta epithymum TaxID=186058 RepID=A0AAV0GJL8_9ASTE|nr:unnamed protein product [Cuscuta epithymum]CAH9148090.1 unnamed protein product [Cuscuta epithymum]